jgi:hypothetical protein
MYICQLCSFCVWIVNSESLIVVAVRHQNTCHIKTNEEGKHLRDIFMGMKSVQIRQSDTEWLLFD